MKYLKASILILTTLFCLTSQARPGKKTENWADYVIPLPHEMKVSGSVVINADDLRLEPTGSKDSQIQSAEWIIRKAARQEGGKGKFTIRLKLQSEANGVPADMIQRLKTLPNADQAYVIHTDRSKKIITIVGNTPRGLIYGATTLIQLFKVPDSRVIPFTYIEVPFVEITDWPDIMQRGQWGQTGVFSSRHAAIEFFSRWKLNMIKKAAAGNFDRNDHKTAVLHKKNETDTYINEAWKMGILVVPYLPHIGMTFYYSDLKYALTRKNMAHLKDMLRVHGNGKRLGKHGLCLSSPLTKKYITEWLMLLAESVNGKGDQMGVYLSEGYVQCHCPKCKDKNMMLLETKVIADCYQQIKKKYPNVHLTLFLTQGSYEYNDKILAAIPKDIRICFYHGGKTYNAAKVEMIPPLLEDFAAKGGFLDVVPIVTNFWGTTVPWTGPQFIKYRCNEFVDKKLKAITSYAVPSFLYHDFNVTAFAEWSWNAKGRSPADFSRAYATVKKIYDPKLYAQWAIEAGDAGWDLAASFFCPFVGNDPAVGLYGNKELDFRYGGVGNAQPIPDYEKTMATAKKAFALSKELGLHEPMLESEITLYLLESYSLIQEISKIVHSGKTDAKISEELNKKLNRLDFCAHKIESGQLAWMKVIEAQMPPGTGPNCRSRIFHVAFMLLKTCDILRNVCAPFMIKDPRPDSRFTDLAEWSAKDFSKGKAIKTVDLTKVIPPQGGRYLVEFEHLDGYNIYIKENQMQPAIFKIGKDGKKVKLFPNTDKNAPWQMWPADHHRKVILIPPRNPGDKLLMEVNMLCGAPVPDKFPEEVPAKDRICNGIIGIRALWETGEFPIGNTLKRELKVIKPKYNAESSVSAQDNKSRNDGIIDVAVSAGYGAEPLVKVINAQEGMKATLVTTLSPEVLAPYDVLVLPQQKMHSAKKLIRAAKDITEWVVNGGGILCTHDAVGFKMYMAMFKSVGWGDKMVKGEKIKITAASPITEGLKPGTVFRPGFCYDFDGMKAGKAGTVLACGEGSGVAALISGKFGKGRVILNGMLPGTSSSLKQGKASDCMPEGVELKLFINSIKWLGSGNKKTDNKIEKKKENLVKNGSAEQGSGKKSVPDWKLYVGSGSVDWGRTSKEAHSGKYSVLFSFYDRLMKGGKARLNAAVYVGGGDGISGKEAISVEPESIYEFSFWVKGNLPRLGLRGTGWPKGDESSKSRQRLKITSVRKNGFPVRITGAPNRRYGRKAVIQPTGEWTKYSGKVTMAHNTAKFALGIAIENSSQLQPGQTVYIDDVSISKIGKVTK